MITPLSREEFHELDSSHGKILESWINSEISNEEFFHKSKDIMEKIKKHSVSFGNDENSLESFLYEVSNDNKWIKDTIHHEKQHALAIKVRGWIPEYILIKLKGDEFIPSVKTLNSEEFKLDKLDFVNYRIELSSIVSEMSPLDKESLKPLIKCREYLEGL